VTQSAEHPILGFGSDHDPEVTGSSPTSGFVLSAESASGFLSLSLPLTLSLSLK